MQGNNSFPKLELPKGGGAIQGIGEKFQTSPVTGSSSFSVPIALSPGRSGFTPSVSLSYDSGAGNSAFGLGWNVGVPVVTRKTQKELPQYLDSEESDTFILAGAEDLVPYLEEDINGKWQPKTYKKNEFTIHLYRPRTEGSYIRIEKWVHKNGEVHWRTKSRENITAVYGESDLAKINHPKYPNKTFKWFLEKQFDDKGNCIVYQYKKEDGINVLTSIHEKNRKEASFNQRYLKKISYGNLRPYDGICSI